MATMPGRTLISMYATAAGFFILVKGVCKDSGDSQVEMLLDILHCCNLGLKLGVACGLDLDLGCPATLVGELKQANNVVEPACNLI